MLRVSPPEVGGPRNRLRGRSAIRLMVLVRVPDVRFVSSRLGLFHPCGPTCAVEPCGRFLRLPESIGSIVASLLSADQSAIGVYLIRQYRCPCRYVSRSSYLSMTRLELYEKRHTASQSLHFPFPIIDNERKRERERNG